MEQTLRNEILLLEQRIQELSEQMTKPEISSAERQRITQEIELVRTTLGHYRKMIDLHSDLSPPFVKSVELSHIGFSGLEDRI